jgi:hypothetical protein
MVSRPHRRRRGVWNSAAARRLLTLAGSPSSVEEAVRTVVRGLLDGIACPPTDLDTLRLKVNVVKVVAEDLPVSGELRRDGSRFVIHYSSTLSPQRRRFTIAHEIAHALFETTGPKCPKNGRELERLCDMLATEILMPRELFVASAKGLATVQGVFDLARLFNTSLSAAAIRLAETYPVSVFEVEDGFITWSYGRIIRGSIVTTEDDLRSAIQAAFENRLTNQTVLLRNRDSFANWCLESAGIGDGSRRLFLLKPPIPLTSARQ